jgi:hypothetical protein
LRYCELDSTWKGGLLAGILLIVASTLGMSFYMAISKPRHFVFDKEDHRAIDVTSTVSSFDSLAIELKSAEDEGDEDDIDDEWRNRPK